MAVLKLNFYVVFFAISLSFGVSATKSDPQEKPQELYHNNVLVLNDANFRQYRDSVPLFVKFYAPWCSHCRDLEPTWVELAKRFKGKNFIRIAKVDCTVQKDLCVQEGIEGYPTLRLYLFDQEPVRYEAARTLSALEIFAKEYTARFKEILGSAGEVDEIENDVHVASVSNFNSLTKSGFSFVLFMAHWCQHCKHLLPVWERLGAHFHHEAVQAGREPVKIIKVDCASEQTVCSSYSVAAYPTLHLFKNGRLVGPKYQGGRSLEAFIDFVNSMRFEEGSARPPMEILSDNGVSSLTDLSFDQGIEKGWVFVMFYTEGCALSKTARPQWEQLAMQYSSTMSIAKLDCEKNPQTCSDLKISGYPMFILFRDGIQEGTFPVKNERTFSEFVLFLEVRFHLMSSGKGPSDGSPHAPADL